MCRRHAREASRTEYGNIESRAYQITSYEPRAISAPVAASQAKRFPLSANSPAMSKTQQSNGKVRCCWCFKVLGGESQAARADAASFIAQETAHVHAGLHAKIAAASIWESTRVQRKKGDPRLGSPSFY